MIRIKNKQDCCGCSACSERCPRSCITMQADEEGFLYPKVDDSDCIECGLCERVCPILNTDEPVRPLKVYVARHNDEEIRKFSSSGGVFTAIAEAVIHEGGVVFGARFDKDWQVVHAYSDTIEGLSVFRGSKYVQSSIGNSYKEVETFLKQGRKVLFTGTPCQIAGLKHYLRKDYYNLLTVDLICHGVPSPMVWSRYVETLRPEGTAGEDSVPSLKKKPVITGIFFRDKRAGWRKYGFSAWVGLTEGSDKDMVFPPKGSKLKKYEILQQNVYMRGFLQHLYLRPSCYNCQFRSFKSGSDLIMADFWGVERMYPELSDDKGISLIIQKSEKINEILKDNSFWSYEIPSELFGEAFKGNGALFNNPQPSKNKSIFWRDLSESKMDVISLIKKNTIFSLREEFKASMIAILLDIGVYNTVNKIIKKIKRIK